MTRQVYIHYSKTSKWWAYAQTAYLLTWPYGEEYVMIAQQREYQIWLLKEAIDLERSTYSYRLTNCISFALNLTWSRFHFYALCGIKPFSLSISIFLQVFQSLSLSLWFSLSLFIQFKAIHHPPFSISFGGRFGELYLALNQCPHTYSNSLVIIR